MPKLAPIDADIALDALICTPYQIYRRLRSQAPIVQAPAIGRTLVTKAIDTRFVKENPHIFSSNEPNPPMERAFQAHTLMRKDGPEHLQERNAMKPTFAARNIQDHWSLIYTDIANEFVAALPRGETVDLFTALAGPFAARCLGKLMGIDCASDSDLQRWSQNLIDGAGNFGRRQDLFDLCDITNREINACVEQMVPQHKASPNPSALSVMLNAQDPIPFSQIRANLKIAIGGGINEPRDALLTILFGLLSNPEQMQAAQKENLWNAAFEEGVRWVAPIQVSSRYTLEDTQIRDILIPKATTLLTIMASANHDEDLWEQPEKFNIWRPKQTHQAFGNGPHFCLGTHIARRMLVQIMLPILCDRFQNMRLAAPEKVAFTGFAFRGPTSLPVVLN